MKYVSERELKKAYNLYKELYKKANKREKMYGKQLTEYQYQNAVMARADQDRSLASISKELVDIDKYKYTRQEAKRIRQTLTNNKVFMDTGNYTMHDIDIVDIRKGNFDEVYEKLTGNMSADYHRFRNQGLSSYDARKQISKLYYGSD